MIMQLEEIRKLKKVKLKDIKLDSRTVHKIEAGDDSVSLRMLKVYLDAVGLEVVYCLK